MIFHKDLWYLFLPAFYFPCWAWLACMQPLLQNGPVGVSELELPRVFV